MAVQKSQVTNAAVFVAPKIKVGTIPEEKMAEVAVSVLNMTVSTMNMVLDGGAEDWLRVVHPREGSHCRSGAP